MESKLKEFRRRSLIDNAIYAKLQARLKNNFASRALKGNTVFLTLPAEELLIRLDHNANTATIHPTFMSKFPKDIADMQQFLEASAGFLVEEPRK